MLWPRSPSRTPQPGRPDSETSVSDRKHWHPPWNYHTVDGSEILRSPVEVDSLSHYFALFPGFYKTSQKWLALGFLNHQQVAPENGCLRRCEKRLPLLGCQARPSFSGTQTCCYFRQGPRVNLQQRNGSNKNHFGPKVPRDFLVDFLGVV